VRRLFGLILFVMICVGVIGSIRSEPIQSWLADQRTSTLPDSVATTLATDSQPDASELGAGVRGLIVLPDDGRFAILDELSAAQISIDLYIYLLPADEVIDILHDAHERGVRVRVILERDPFGGGNSNQEAFDRLTAAGISVKWSDDRFWFSHIKTVVIDEDVAVIMTLNLSWTALTANREFAVVTTNRADVKDLLNLFEADWKGSAYVPSGSIVTSPDNSRAVVSEFLERAQISIDIYAEVVRDAAVRDQLISAARSGVSVRILVPTDPEADDLLIYRELEGNGVQVTFMTNAYSHAKAVIIDRRITLVGSQNLTETSLNENREAGIILEDEVNVARLVAYFESDWNIGERLGTN
jgi:phosphatidylserine/phosphatidylglycerophosphate/cardiolipin synthase-like enzyme